jgi:hypothetical protein
MAPVNVMKEGWTAQLGEGVVIGCTGRLCLGYYTVPSIWS